MFLCYDFTIKQSTLITLLQDNIKLEFYTRKLLGVNMTKPDIEIEIEIPNIEPSSNEPNVQDGSSVPVVDIVNARPERPRMSEEELLEKEKELLGNEFILPTLEDANIVFQLGEEVGPLDVLLELIKQTKLDIMEVHLADLTEQFLGYMAQTEMNMEQKSEFVSVAATLLEIKSKNLLPTEPIESEEDEEDPELALKRRLQMYKVFKEASQELALLENNDHFYKEPDKSAGDYKIILKDMNMQNLIDAFSKLLVKVEKKEVEQEEKQIKKDRFTLADSIVNLRNTLTTKKVVKFSECFASDFTRGEIIITFLAMLELLKKQFATAEQNETFGEIEIKLKEVKEDEQETRQEDAE